jgi:hypothetical protein
MQGSMVRFSDGFTCILLTHFFFNQKKKKTAAARLRVAPHISQLRTVVEEMETRSKERHWARHQLDGEMDDEKVVESLVGERAVFKRRIPPPKHEQSHFRSNNDRDRDGRKKIHFVVDVSGSMYRFNGYDGRLVSAVFEFRNSRSTDTRVRTVCWKLPYCYWKASMATRTR